MKQKDSNYAANQLMTGSVNHRQKRSTTTMTGVHQGGTPLASLDERLLRLFVTRANPRQTMRRPTDFDQLVDFATSAGGTDASVMLRRTGAFLEPPWPLPALTASAAAPSRRLNADAAEFNLNAFLSSAPPVRDADDEAMAALANEQLMDTLQAQRQQEEFVCVTIECEQRVGRQAATAAAIDQQLASVGETPLMLLPPPQPPRDVSQDNLAVPSRWSAQAMVSLDGSHANHAIMKSFSNEPQLGQYDHLAISDINGELTGLRHVI